ncbi:MAG: caspase family protein [Candidatus Electrothrix sp. AUS4]|nr:caspase family protein [Candidatus Electrothrix sp. AUS4]
MNNRWIITILVLLVVTPVQGADLFNKSYAVVIGISKYQNSGTWKTLDNAENDAQAMKDFLTGQGFEVKSFTGAEAKKYSIISYLEDILALKLTLNDRFVFYFSGHGNTRRVGGRDRGYLIPYDGDTKKASTWIAMEQLQDLADKLGNARHQLFILDSCFGGLFATKGSPTTVPEGTPGYISTVTGSRARQYLTAGGTNQETPARSNLTGYRQYSYYTAYLLKGLREGAADTHPDGYITASELNAYLEPAAATNYNTPRGGHFPGHEQGDFVFRSPKTARTIVRNTSPVSGPTKGNDKNSYEVERLRAEVERLRKAEQAKPKISRSTGRIAGADEQSVSKLTSQDQAQALYEWQHDIVYANNSQAVEDFLRRFPTGSHVPEAKRKLAELRAQGL